MNLLKPNMYYHSIYTVPYESLKKRGIKCVLFDLDNTCVGYHEKKPTKELKKLFDNLNHLGIKVVIFSNTTPKRIEPFQELPVLCHPLSRKPFKGNFIKILREFHLKKENVCIIGDQLFTDVLGGNRIGIKTCLVEPLSPYDFIGTKLFRFLEKRIKKHLKLEIGDMDDKV